MHLTTVCIFVGGEFEVESMERAEERREVISVVKEMIESYEHLYELQPEIQDEVLQLLQETSPECVDHLLKRKYNETRQGLG